MVVLVNMAKVATATIGTGTMTLGASVAGFQDFDTAGVADGDVVRYGIKDGATGFEVGTGTYTATGTELSRATILDSSNGGAAINLSGSAVVFITATAEDFANILKTNATANLTAAYTALVDPDGTFTTGTYTPTTAAGSNSKHIINGGAFEFGPPTLAANTTTNLSVIIVNNASAGAITTSFGSVAGDPFTTTDGDAFACHIEAWNIGGTLYSSLITRLL
jgi:hypothetical protein